jgi:hypothetical protein
MSAVIRPIADIDRRGREILTRDLGIVDTLRFLGQFRAGSGDYTAERGTWLDDLSLDTVVSEIKGRRRKTRRTKG